jgi:hypothetical protein
MEIKNDTKQPQQLNKEELEKALKDKKKQFNKIIKK